MPAARPKDRLRQFVELRRSFYHLLDLMKELEESVEPEAVAPVFARAANRLSLAANEFADIAPELLLVERSNLDSQPSTD